MRGLSIPSGERSGSPSTSTPAASSTPYLHLLYARFFTKVMRDLGLVDFDEPMTRLRNQGNILGPDGQKMSKSRGNVVNPQEYVDRFGSDALRGFLMFIGPWNEGGPWDGKGIEGVSRWLRRALSLVTGGDSSGGEADPTELERRTNRLIKKITDDLEAFRFNTSIAALMEHTNYLLAVRGRVGNDEWHEALRTFVTVLSPFAPHHAEELWAEMGEEYSVHEQAWPGYEEALIQAPGDNARSPGQRQAARPYRSPGRYLGRGG